MPYSTILVKKEEGIATVTLNRPHRRNAMNEHMCEELADALGQLSQDDEVRVVILTGTGGVFCAGADLVPGDEMEQTLVMTNPEDVRRNELWAAAFFRLLHTMEKPTIAMVNGAAVGGGLDCALCCDIRIGSEKARFRSYCHMGMTPEVGTFLMPRIMGYPKAVELFFTADFWNAQQAKEAGILNRVVPAEELERETMELARRITQNPPTAIRLGKLLLRKGGELDFDAALNLGTMATAIAQSSEDLKEALAAFREKRQPQFGKKRSQKTPSRNGA